MIDALDRELELRFGVYGRLFRFDPSAAAFPLKVRIFTEQNLYDAYVLERLGNPRPGAVYLHYGQKEKRELVIHRGSPEEKSMLPHQAFMQFLRAHIPNPPAWLREGFAVYFGALGFDPSGEGGEGGGKNRGTLLYEENLAWLETAKNLGEDAPSIKDLLEADAGEEAPTLDFKVASWALVSFFLAGGKEDYYRSLLESFMVLSPEASSADNGLAVTRRISLWTDFEAMERDYAAYIRSRKTFAEFIEEGRGAYAAGDNMNAELSFLGALNQKPAHHAPYYYLGLIYYRERNFDMAEEYYLSSLKYGAGEALVYYALGINAYSAGRGADAKSWLEKAAGANPEKYGARTEELLENLRKREGG
jgi:tetratricopeptide (TPR) repeat protein